MLTWHDGVLFCVGVAVTTNDQSDVANARESRQYENPINTKMREGNHEFIRFAFARYRNGPSWTAEENESHAIMDRFVASGGNFLDTADIYTTWSDKSYGGKTEEIMGRWLKSRKNRQDLVIATKVRGNMWEGANGEGLSRAHILRAVDDSLRRLQSDYIDLYQCHWADTSTPIEETLSTLNDLVRAGKVRYVGASNYPAWRLMEAIATSEKHNYVRFDSYQPEYSLMVRQKFEPEAMQVCKHYGLGVIPYSPLAGGWLSGKYRREGTQSDSVRLEGLLKSYGNDRGYTVIETLEKIAKENAKTVAQTALAWMLSNPIITAPILGANTVSQLDDILGAAGYRLSAEQVETLNKVTSFEWDWRPIWD